jgi:hypothetical protein
MSTDYQRYARILRKWLVLNGVVSASAFQLRANIHETYISLLDESSSCFVNDAKSVTKESPILYASLLRKEIKAIKLYNVKETVCFEICPVDSKRLKSHTGLYIFVDHQPVIGGEPFVTSLGQPVNVVMLQIKLASANLASKRIKERSR